MYLCLFEDDKTDHLLPLVFTRAVYDLRLGIRTMLDTTRDAFGRPPTILHARRSVAGVTAQDSSLPVNNTPEGADILFVNGRFIAEEGPALERLRQATRTGERARLFTQKEELIAAWYPNAPTSVVKNDTITPASFIDMPEDVLEGARFICRLWHLLDEIHPALDRDYKARIKQSSVTQHAGANISNGVLLVNAEQIYIAPGASVRPGAILNAENGPIYIDKDAVVMEAAVLRGPLYLGPLSQIKVGANVEGCVVGPWSKAGGEMANSVLHSFSSKAHTGYLGNSYVGRWCNLGADSNTSNLKNDYSVVSLFNYGTGKYESTGRQFAGLIMGDHSKCGINTMFNTGTVIGVFCNIYGSGFQPRYIPSFSWGGTASGLIEYRLDKALGVAEAVMARRNTQLTLADREMLTSVFETGREERLAMMNAA